MSSISSQLLGLALFLLSAGTYILARKIIPDDTTPVVLNIGVFVGLISGAILVLTGGPDKKGG